jgi:hypothetical protein
LHRRICTHQWLQLCTSAALAGACGLQSDAELHGTAGMGQQGWDSRDGKCGEALADRPKRMKCLDCHSRLYVVCDGHGCGQTYLRAFPVRLRKGHLWFSVLRSKHTLRQAGMVYSRTP